MTFTQSAIPMKIPKRWTMSLYLVVSQTCPTIQAKFRDLGSPKLFAWIISSDETPCVYYYSNKTQTKQGILAHNSNNNYHRFFAKNFY